MRKRDTELRRQHEDARRHSHGRAAHSGCPADCNPGDHHLCPAREGWEPASVNLKATCRTDGCRVADRTFSVSTFSNADGILRVMCGKCGEWIEDLVEV